MIEPWLIDEVRRLLAEKGMSQRAIARRLGVSRGTVNAVALGKRPEPRQRQEPAEEEPSFRGPLGRCPSCGGMVQMPCLLCRVRAMKESAPARAACDPRRAQGPPSKRRTGEYDR